MKPIAAVAITAATLALAGCSSGGDTQATTGNKDVDFINTLKSHGLHAPAGMDESQWEKLSIDTAHSMCDMLGMRAGGVTMMRGQALIDNSQGEAKIRNEATVSIFCPEKR
jgi:hypothetical protein